MTTNATYQQTVENMKEVAAGKRGFVSLTKRIAAECGTTQAQLVVVAKVLGLQIDRGGRHGYCAVR